MTTTWTSNACCDRFNAVAVAIEAAGGRRQLAEQLNVSRQAVEAWLAAGSVPPKRVPDVARVTGIPKKVLNPIFKD